MFSPQICLLDPDDDLFGNNSDSSTKPLVDDPDYVPMYGANGAESGSTSTHSISPDLPSYGHYGSSLSSLPSPTTARPFYGGLEDRRAPPLPPPNHLGPRSSSSSPSTPTMPRDKNENLANSRRVALPRSATYDNDPGSSRTLPRSMRGHPDGGATSPWLLHQQQQQTPQPRSQSQQTLPRPAKRVWFPQSGDKKPNTLTQSSDRLPSSPHLRDDRHPSSAPSTEEATQRKPRPPLKPKPLLNRAAPAPLILPSAEEQLASSPGGGPPEDIKYSGDPPRTPNGLVYPVAPPRMEDQQGPAAAGSRLMEYCDELLQELETMAKG